MPERISVPRRSGAALTGGGAHAPVTPGLEPHPGVGASWGDHSFSRISVLAPQPEPDADAPDEQEAEAVALPRVPVQRAPFAGVPGPVVQRDPAPATVTAGPGGGPAAAQPDFGAMSWQDLLPRARGEKNGKPVQIAKVQNDKNVAPTLNYDDKNIKTDPSKGAKAVEDPSDQSGKNLLDDVLNLDWRKGIQDYPAAMAAAERLMERQKAFDAAVDAAVARIVVARAAIPHRGIDRAPSTHGGNFYDPTQPGWQPKDDPKKKDADWDKERAKNKKDNDPQGAEYKKWIDAATPTGLDTSKPDELKKWQIFQATIPLEGHVGEFTTFDKTLSVGVGFSTSGGQAQKVIGKVFNLLPEVKSVAEAAGLLADGSGGMTVVDTSRKWILEGQDAAAYIQTDEALLSLLINVSQGVQPTAPPPPGGATPAPADEQRKQRQAFLDAEYQTFLSHAVAGIPAAILAWPLASAVLAVHSRHGAPAYFPWSFWEKHLNSDLKAMVTAIYDNLKSLDQLTWLIPICDAEPYRSLAESVKKEKEAAAPPVQRKAVGTPDVARTVSPGIFGFGHDFGRVQIHTDARASDAAESLAARAYAAGHGITKP